jgi:hypothetical protein
MHFLTPLHSETFGYLAGIISILAYFPYIYAIINDRGKPDTDGSKCKPKRASWIIWITTSWIILLTMKVNTSTFAIWQALAYAIGATVTLALSIFYGQGGWAMSDRVFLGLAFAGLLLWWIFHSAWYAFALALLVDGMGIMPIVKARGAGENPTGWSLFFLGSLSNIGGTFGISNKTINLHNPHLADLLYPWIMTLIVLLPTLMVWRSHLKLKSRLWTR